MQSALVNVHTTRENAPHMYLHRYYCFCQGRRLLRLLLFVLPYAHLQAIKVAMRRLYTNRVESSVVKLIAPL